MTIKEKLVEANARLSAYKKAEGICDLALLVVVFATIVAVASCEQGAITLTGLLVAGSVIVIIGFSILGIKEALFRGMCCTARRIDRLSDKLDKEEA